MSSGEAALYAACMALETGYGNGMHGKRTRSESRCDGVTNRSQCTDRHHWQTRTLDLSYLWLQAAGWDKQVVLRKVQSGDKIADIGTKVLERDTIQEQWKTWDVSARTNKYQYESP